MADTKKFATLALIILLASVSAAMVTAQDVVVKQATSTTTTAKPSPTPTSPAPSDVVVKAPTVTAPKPPEEKKPPEALKKEEKPAAPEEVQFWQYVNENNNIALSARDPATFAAKPPDGWGKTTIVTQQYSATPEARALIMATMKEKGIPPTDVYENKAIFQISDNERIIVDGPNAYQITSNGLVDTVPNTYLGEVWIRYDFKTGKSEYILANTLEHVPESDIELIKEQHTEIRAFEERAKKAAALNSEANTRVTVQAVMSVFHSFATYFKEYQGLAGWSSLIFDEAWLKNWRDEVNRVMCDSIGIAGNQCWASKICATYSDIKPPRNGVLYTNPLLGPLRAIAHIEGRKSAPIPTPNGTIWVYTVTFSITNPTEKDMTYNVRFAGAQRTAAWWKQAPVVPKGGTASALGASALIKQSPTPYDTVVLEFAPPIIDIDGDYVRETRNALVQTSTASAPYGPAPTTTTAGVPATPATTPSSNLPGADV